MLQNLPPDIDTAGLIPGQLIHVCHKVVDGACVLSANYRVPDPTNETVGMIIASVLVVSVVAFVLAALACMKPVR